MYINSPGGQIDAGLAIYDTMHLIQPRVATTCIGMAGQHGRRIARRGARGKRSALPNSRILIHPASAGFQGTAFDIEVQAREIIRMNARLQEMMAADTGQSVERLSHDINRDYWMSAAEAKDYGVVDLIVGQTDATVAADRAEAAVKDTPVVTAKSSNGTHRATMSATLHPYRRRRAAPLLKARQLDQASVIGAGTAPGDRKS